MAIEKNYVKASAPRFDSEFSMGSRSRESMFSDDDELHRRNSADSEDDDDDEYDDADSGAGSDDFDLLELGETRSEFCQDGDQTCSIPFELYDLHDLQGILSLDVWNDSLTEEERFGLTKYLPDLDQETFMRTLKELFDGSNFHFGSPITKLFQMLKGGLCEPRVSLYRQGLSFFQKHKHYHLLQKHQDSMVASLLQMREAWQNCKGYSIEEKLRVLNIVRSQKSLMGERHEDIGSDSSEKESAEALWGKRSKGRSSWKKVGHDSLYGVSPSLDVSQGRSAAIHPTRYGKKNPKGLLKLGGSKNSSLNEIVPRVHSHQHGYQSLKSDSYVSDLVPPRRGKATTYDAMTASMREQIASGDDEREGIYEMASQRDWNVVHCNVMDRGRSAKSGKKHGIYRVDEYDGDSYSSLPFSVKNDSSCHGLFVTKLNMPDRLENSRSLSRSVCDQKEKRARRDVKGSVPALDGILPASSTMDDFGRHEIDTYFSKNRQKAKMLHLQNFTSRVPEDGYYSGYGNTNAENNRKSTHRLWRNGQQEAELAGSSLFSMDKTPPVDNVGYDFISLQSKHLQDYTMAEDGGLFETDPVAGFASSVKKQKQNEDSTEIDGLEGYDDMQSHQQLFETVPLRKQVKKRSEPDMGFPDVGSSELPIVEVGMADLELELKPQKKSFTLITPTIHTDFSFSVIHLLSAVRMALITPNIEDTLEVGKHNGNAGVRADDGNGNHEHMNGSIQQLDVKNAGQHDQTNIPSLTIQEVLDRVRSNPGDPSILETQEPLQDLVRGVLKIFSSKTAPLGAKGWNQLVSYEKGTKSWTWTGPIPQSSTDHETLEEVTMTSPDAWRIPHKMLVKLVDSFANWLKRGQETLRQIGSLPAPPLELMQLNFDEKERFRDLRAQKSLSTISKSSEEARAYFRKEEQLRYSVPDRAFSYTAADGKKSIVAPLRRCGGKPASKARDHFMLKRDRPAHVTILCLVRDAAARLPGSIGTRADVCTLIRDSQYVVEDVSDPQVNQVVSGALDRLHYERDPCVQFDGERKLWVYLHREREEEDFEDDGTSSTKKWKRQKKDAPEPDDQVTVACPGSGGPSGLDLSSDLNVEPLCINNDKVLCDDTRQRRQDDVKASNMPKEEGPFQQMLESKLHCQENSANEDFDDDT